MSIQSVRRAIALLSVVILASCILVPTYALSTSGEWIEVHGTDSLDIQWDGSCLVLEGEVELASNMPFEMEGLSFDIVMTDDSRGSYATVLSVDSIDVPPHGSVALVIDEELPIESMLLMVRDRLTIDGEPLEFRISASCGYLMGLASFQVDAVLNVVIVEDGETLSIDVEDVGISERIIAIDGLKQTLIPEPQTISASGGGESVTIDIGTSDGALLITAVSSGELDGALQRISSSEDLVIEGANLDAQTLRIIGEVLDRADRLRRA